MQYYLVIEITINYEWWVPLILLNSSRILYFYFLLLVFIIRDTSVTLPLALLLLIHEMRLII